MSTIKANEGRGEGVMAPQAKARGQEPQAVLSQENIDKWNAEFQRVVALAGELLIPLSVFESAMRDQLAAIDARRLAKPMKYWMEQS